MPKKTMVGDAKKLLTNRRRRNNEALEAARKAMGGTYKKPKPKAKHNPGYH